MKKDTKDIEVSPARLGMTLEDLLREGARELMEKAVAMELAELLGDYETVKLPKCVACNLPRASACYPLVHPP